MTPQLRQGTMGMKLASEEVVLTLTGRTTTPFIRTLTKKETIRQNYNAMHKEAERWLIENAYLEALARNDNFNATTFGHALKNTFISQSEKDCAEMYLFDYQLPVLPPLFREN